MRSVQVGLPRLKRLIESEHPISAVCPVLAGFLGGLGFLLAMPPSDIYPFAIVCLVPLLYILREGNLFQSLLAGSMVSLVGFISIPIAVISRGPEVFTGTVVLMCLGFGLPSVVTALGTKLTHPRYVSLLFPMAFVMTQFVMEQAMSIPMSIAILFPVEAFHGSNIFPSIGGHGVDLVLITLNVLIFEAIRHRGEPKGLLVAGISILVFGIIALAPTSITQPTRHIVVTAVDPGISNSASLAATRDPTKMLSKAQLFDRLTRDSFANDVDLIVWPETGNGLANAQLPHRLAAIRELQTGTNSSLLATGVHFSGEGKQYNSAHLFEQGELVTTLTKKRLVPMVEDNFSSGQLSAVPIKDKGLLGIGVCFDSAFADVMGDLVREGAEALLIVSNDASFGISGLSALHIRYSALKALEQQRELLFVSNTGPVIHLSQEGRVKDGYWSSSAPMTSTYPLNLSPDRTLFSSYPRVMQMITLAICLLLIGIMTKRETD